MMNTPELRQRCSTELQTAVGRASEIKAFMGFDGFVDNILHAVDKRESAEEYDAIPTLTRLADRIAAAAGRSTNIELVSQQIKLGGNGPIMANALARFGLRICYLGCLGYPGTHPAFADFANLAEVHSIADPGFTDALEFQDGKLMLGKHDALKQLTWDNVCSRFGRDQFADKLREARFVAFVNWTMLPGMNGIWAATLNDICPQLQGPRRRLFFDLADPEKRTDEDIAEALDLVGEFQKYFDVVLGLNEKESSEIGRVLDLDTNDHSPEGLAALGGRIQERLKVDTVVIHPVAFAVAATKGDSAVVEGPFTPKPLITTGAGDHFNAGFCLGKLLGFDNASSLLTGVATSGTYVRTGRSPGLADLVHFMQHWPVK